MAAAGRGAKLFGEERFAVLSNKHKSPTKSRVSSQASIDGHSARAFGSRDRPQRITYKGIEANLKTGLTVSITYQGGLTAFFLVDPTHLCPTCWNWLQLYAFSDTYTELLGTTFCKVCVIAWRGLEPIWDDEASLIQEPFASKKPTIVTVGRQNPSQTVRIFKILSKGVNGGWVEEILMPYSLCPVCWHYVLRKGIVDISFEQLCNLCRRANLRRRESSASEITFRIPLPNLKDLPPIPAESSHMSIYPSTTSIDIAFDASHPYSRFQFEVLWKDFCQECLRFLISIATDDGWMCRETQLCGRCQRKASKWKASRTRKAEFKGGVIPGSLKPSTIRTSNSDNDAKSNRVQDSPSRSAASENVSYEEVARLIGKADRFRLCMTFLELCQLSPALRQSTHMLLKPYVQPAAGSSGAHPRLTTSLEAPIAASSLTGAMGTFKGEKRKLPAIRDNNRSQATTDVGDGDSKRRKTRLY